MGIRAILAGASLDFRTRGAAVTPPPRRAEGGFFGPSQMRSSAPKVPSRALNFNPRRRIAIVAAFFTLVYGIIGARIIMLGMESPKEGMARLPPAPVARPDILDRNGAMLATDIPRFSIYAEPRRMIDLDEAVEGLTGVFPDISPLELRRQLAVRSGFVWIRRMVTPDEKERVWALGIPGVGFRTEARRFYPNGSEAAHVLGSVNTDNSGIAGIEKWIDNNGLEDLKATGVDFKKGDLKPVQLSLDLRVQHVLSDELTKAVAKFGAIAGAGMVLDVRNGEVLALVSLPDFDPNSAEDALKPDRINRVNVGVYEMGSTFKALTTAMALDSGVYKIDSVLDASQPLRFGKFRINDYRGQGRPLTVPESFIYSSNIAMARMAMGVGAATQQQFLRKVGQLDRLTTELPESAQPLIPQNWSTLSTATVAFGHGIAVAPIQATMAIAAMVNGGDLIRPTFIKGSGIEDRIIAKAVITPQTSEAIRYLMRLNAEVGSAAKANIPGYYIGGKTGTSNKVVNGRYSEDKVRNAFMGVAPADDPRYLFMTLLDEPKGLPETSGFRTSGWNAVPVTGAIMARALPMLDIAPRSQPPQNPFPTMMRLNAWGSDRFRDPKSEPLAIAKEAAR